MAPLMKLTIPAVSSEPSGPVTERQYTTEGDGFTLMFQMPFKREDVFRELMAENQLGVDHSTIRMKITQPGNIESARLRKELETTATASEARDIQTFIDQAHVKYEVGCQRTVYFPDGPVVSELIDLVENERIQWKQISSERQTNMIGSSDDKKPVITIALDEARAAAPARPERRPARERPPRRARPTAPHHACSPRSSRTAARCA
jgi:hypothetical protein